MKRRFDFTEQSPNQILIRQAKSSLADAQKMPAGAERDRAMTRARALQTQANAERWANSPGLRPPK